MKNLAHREIDSLLQAACTGKSHHNTGVVDGVGAGEETAFAVFEPLGKNLVAPALVGPEVGGDAIEVLGWVDADASKVRVVFNLGDGAVTLATEATDGVVELGRTHQVQVDELLTKFGQLEEGVTIFGERNARKIGLQELDVALSVRRGLEHCIHVGEDVLG